MNFELSHWLREEWLYRQIVEVLRLIASPAEIQLESFPDYVCKPDEIVFTLQEVVEWLDNKTDLLSAEQFALLHELIDYTDTFATKEWTLEGVEKSEKWTAFRDKAIQLLAQLGEKYRKPVLFWISDGGYPRGRKTRENTPFVSSLFRLRGR